MKTNSIVSLSVVLVLLPAFCELGFCEDRSIMMKTLGGVHGWKGSENIVDIENIGRFAVEEHNKKENGLLEFARVLNAREQVVAGKIYHLTLEAVDAGKRKPYDAKVWVKPWMNFKKLLEFKHSHDTPLVTYTDLGVKKASHGSGWSVVSTFDPVVRDAALHAVKIIQNRSNSLYPYQLLEILMAKAKVLRDSTEFSLLLKVRRGSKEEKFKVVVNKNTRGVFHLNLMEQDFS